MTAKHAVRRPAAELSRTLPPAERQLHPADHGEPGSLHSLHAGLNATRTR